MDQGKYSRFRRRSGPEGAASGIEFIIGIPGNERQVFRSFIGNEKIEDLLVNYWELFSQRFICLLQDFDASCVPDEKSLAAYIKKQAATMPELEVKAKLFEMAHVLSMYLWGRRLSEGGNRVYLLDTI